MNEIIRKDIISEIEGEIDIFSHQSRLCSATLRYYVVIYNLSGTIQQAIERLKEIKKQLTEHPDSKETRSLISEITNRVPMYQAEKASPGPYGDITGDERKQNVMSERRRITLNELHEKKECVCFI